MLHEGHTYVHAKILYQFRLDWQVRDRNVPVS